jgi:hypothetical protein
VELQLTVHEDGRTVKAQITCHDLVIGDEWHFFRCAKFEKIRNDIHIYQDVSALKRGEDDKFRVLMNPQGDIKMFWEKYAALLIKCRGIKWGRKPVK